MSLSLESQLQIKSLFGLQHNFNKDKQRIQDMLTQCLICIYNSSDLDQYFADMIEISDILKYHYETSLSLHKQIQEIHEGNKGNSKLSSQTLRLKKQFQVLAQPVQLKQMVQEIICDIMNNICDQILAKMRQLGIIVKEPLLRRASFDDYFLCFDSLSKKTASNQALGNIFGYTIGNHYGIFTNYPELRNLSQ